MNKPKEPNIDEFGINLNDFGITNKDLEKVEKYEKFKEGNFIPKLTIVLSALIFLIVFLKYMVGFLFDNFGVFVFLLTIILSFVYFMFILVFNNFLVIFISKTILMLLDVILFRKQRKYLNFVKEYKKKLEEQKRRQWEELEKQRRELKIKWSISELPKYIYRRKYEYWASLNGHIFEEDVGNLLNSIFSDVIFVIGSGGYGNYMLIPENGMNVPVQCKVQKRKIGLATVREFLGLMVANKYKKGIIITVNGASDIAQKLANKNNVEIWDASDLIDLQNKRISK